MIISRTPLRISLVGGGTDTEAFYSKSPGAVVSMAINKYVYIAINDKFDGGYRVSYSITENTETIEGIKHDLARRAMQTLGIKGGLEIVSIADIPGSGSGLGSSSSFIVGLIHALGRRLHKTMSREKLAESAYEIESAGHTEIGRQDHLAAVYGGLNLFKFNKKSVNVKPIEASITDLSDDLLLLWTGLTRSASVPLNAQKHTFDGEGTKIGIEMAALAHELYRQMKAGKFYTVGEYLHENWLLKKSISSFVSTPQIDTWYDLARDNGAVGGKVCGAGGGGFLLFYCHPDARKRIANALGLRIVDFKIEKEGSKIVYP